MAGITSTSHIESDRDWFDNHDQAETDLFLEDLGVLILILDRSGRVRYINGTGEQLLRLSRSEILNRNWFDSFMSAKYRGEAESLFEDAFAGDYHVHRSVEMPFQGSDGAEGHLLWNYVVVQGSEAEGDSMLASAMDITKRVLAEERVRKSEIRFRSLFEAFPDAIFIQSRAGVIMDANPAACRLQYSDRESLIGANLMDFVPADERKAARKDLHRLIEGEIDCLKSVTWTVEHESIPVNICARHIENRDSDSVMLVVRDLTRSGRQGDSFSDIQTRARSILDLSVDGIISTDDRGYIDWVNPSLEKMVGLSTETLSGSKLDVLTPESRRKNQMALFKRILEGETDENDWFPVETFMKSADGRTFPVEIVVRKHRLAGETRFVWFIKNIADRRILEQEVLRVSEEERQSIGGDIHDHLASKFSGIALLARGVANRLDASPEIPVDRESIEYIIEHARVGADKARALARGLNPVRLEELGLKTALAELANEVRTISELTCTLEIADDLPEIQSAYAGQLYRIAYEAVTNVMKHSKASSLLIEVRVTDGYLEVAVTDDGVGMPNIGSEKGGARGMGLHIMDYRARLIHGAMSIESDPGKGTRITCRIPVSDISGSQ